MDREKLLAKIKEELLRYHKDSKYDLEKVVPYYTIIQKENNEILNQLLHDCNKYKFLVSYRYDDDDCNNYGTMYIHINSNKDDGNLFRYGRNNAVHYEIDLLWYKHGSTDEYIPRIVVKKVLKSAYIDCNSYTEAEFNNWYSELKDLQEKVKRENLDQIEKKINNLLREKEKLIKALA